MKKLVTILQQVDALIAPDSGPAHMATAEDTPVIRQYAYMNPDRPWLY